MDNRPIGVFDSGVGGLSVLREMKKLLPNESFIFVADQKHVPYGQKTKEQLEDLTTKIVNFLLAENVKMVIIACNTATVYTIDYLRSRFSLPIVGVVPVVKKLAEITHNKKIGVLSTPATSQSPYLIDLIKKYTAGIKVINRDGGGLEELVERGDLNTPEVDKTLSEVLGPMIEGGIDSLALGCTHYPFLKDKIEHIMGTGVTVLDSGEAVGRQVKRILENNSALSEKSAGDLFFTTGDEGKFKKVAERLLNTKLVNVAAIDLDKI